MNDNNNNNSNSNKSQTNETNEKSSTYKYQVPDGFVSLKKKIFKKFKKI